MSTSFAAKMSTSFADTNPYPLTLEEAQALEAKCQRLYKAHKWTRAQFSVGLRRLQEGQAHVSRGYDSFGSYAEAVFQDLPAELAKKISIEGSLLMILHDAKRISLEKKEEKILPGPAALRRLSAYQNKHGHETMLEIFDEAELLFPNRVITEKVLIQAEKRIVGVPAPAPKVEPVEDPEDDGYDEDPEEVHVVQDSITEIHRVLDDISEQVVIRGTRSALRANLETLRDEINELELAIDQALKALDEADKGLQKEAVS